MVAAFQVNSGEAEILWAPSVGEIRTGVDTKSVIIEYLVFVGTATNICVESTLRHAFSLGYFPMLVSDAVSQMGPAITQEATIFNVRSTFGWVTTSEKLLNAIKGFKRMQIET